MKKILLVVVLISGLPTFAAKSTRLTPPKDLKVLDGLQNKGPDEKLLYASLIKAYRKDDLVQTREHLETLIGFYPQSVYADNAFYLIGILQMKKGQLGESIATFDRVIKEYPRGNKRASALYAKGIAYKKLLLLKPARDHLMKVIENYPGSLESQRAKVELNLIKNIKEPKTANL